MSTTYYKSGLGGIGNFRPCSRARNANEDELLTTVPPPRRLSHSFQIPSIPTLSSLSLSSSISSTLPAHVGIGGAGNRPLDIVQSSQQKSEARLSTQTRETYSYKRFSVRRSWQRLFKTEPSLEKKRASSYMKGSYFDFEDDDDDTSSRASSTGSWKSRLSCSNPDGVDQGLLAARPVSWSRRS